MNISKKIITQDSGNKKKLILKAVSCLSLIQFVFSFLLISSCSKENTPKPNIVVFMIDTLRRDHLGLYGHERETTPNISRLAKSSLVFQNAYTQCPWTAPSIASLFSGLYPSVHGLIKHYGNKAKVLPQGVETIAEVLQTNGYSTAGFTANSWISKGLGFAQGFETFEVVKGVKNAHKKDAFRKTMAVEINEAALPWLKKNRDNPFFLYLHYMDAHAPYDPPPPFDTHFKSDKVRHLSDYERRFMNYFLADKETDGNNYYYYTDHYDGAIRYTDNQIWEVVKKLMSYRLMGNTIVIITSDHGEAFFEHGTYDHGFTVYNEEIRVPLLIRFPKSMKINASRELLNAQVDLIDVSKTILKAVGLDFSKPVNGRDLLSLKTDELADHASFSEELASVLFKGPPKIGMVKGNVKAIYKVDNKVVTELYDLDKDPGEERNRRKDDPATTRKAKKIIKNHINRNFKLKKKKAISNKTAPLSQEQKEKLKSLGYL